MDTKKLRLSLEDAKESLRLREEAHGRYNTDSNVDVHRDDIARKLLELTEHIIEVLEVKCT